MLQINKLHWKLMATSTSKNSSLIQCPISAITSQCTASHKITALLNIKTVTNTNITKLYKVLLALHFLFFYFVDFELQIHQLPIDHQTISYHEVVHDSYDQLLFSSAIQIMHPRHRWPFHLPKKRTELL